ncbi:MAG: thioredoxin family protein [Ferruginibacter sp.]|nr:thioredoxin family protein [Cytophagales bacterium]
MRKNIRLVLTIGWLAVFVAPEARTQSGRIENFTLTDVTSNRPVSLSDYREKEGVVLVFTSHACPYAKLYEERLTGLMTEFRGKGIQFLLINSNASSEETEDAVEQMAKVAQQKGYGLPYLADKDHKVANSLGATKTPEVFVLQNSHGVFSLKYRGAIDDNPQVPTDVGTHYLKEAVQAVLKNTNLSLAERRPTGCLIKRE